MSSAYRRLMVEIQGYHFSSLYKMRLLYMNEKAEEAEATCLLTPVDLMLKLRLVRRNGLWYLVEVVQTDSAYHLASETFRPTIATIEKTRAGQKAPPAGLTDFVRVLMLINNNSPKTISVVDNALKAKPDDKGLRLLKALALTKDENTKAAGLKLLRELGDQGFAPAVYRLATELGTSEDENEMKQALAVYERYVGLEPLDPRGFEGLASGYDHAKDLVKAEAAYRKVIELDPTDTDAYSELVHFLAVNDRIDEAKTVLAAGEKYKQEGQDLFGWAVQGLESDDEPKAAEKFALSEPLRLKKSYYANVALGRVYFNDGRYADALRVLEIAAQIDKEWAEPHLIMAQVYRKQSRWALAVKAAQRAVELDNEDSEAYYQLACALTRLRRIKEALSALSKAVELDEEQVEYMVEEPDLKALSALPGFKKLIPQPAKQ
jgi:tetratricopeptide (TPR) repeat protein